MSFDGSQDWVIVDNDAVAGSSPASGSRCRSSSVVEHVNSQFVSYPSVFQRAVEIEGSREPGDTVQIRPIACNGGANFSTPGNSTVRCNFAATLAPKSCYQPDFGLNRE